MVLLRNAGIFASFFLVVLASSSFANAQNVPATVAETTNFPAERLRLSLNREGVIDAEWGRVLPHLRWDTGLWVGYARDPLVLSDASSRRQLASFVHDRVGAAVFGTIGLFGWIELGVEVPLALYQTRQSSAPAAFTSDLAALSAVGVGDVRVAPKLRLLRSDAHGIDLALFLPFTLPSGGSRAYFGEPSVTFKPELLLSRAWRGPRVVLNLGADVRKATFSIAQTVESELSYRVGFAYRFKDIGRAPWELAATLSGAISMLRPFAHGNQNALEARGMLAYEFVKYCQVFAGAGAGLLPGWGTPDFRVFGGLRVGLVSEPKAVSEAPQALVSSAPASIAVVLDSDGDGIFDDRDRCVQTPEDRDGFEDGDGCPDPDNDADGVLDTVDACADVAGPPDNRGCPDLDSDGDTVVDRFDNCPNQPGPKSNQGCAKKQLVVLTRTRLEILDSVYFESAKAKIKAVSFPLLDNVAEVLRAHPETHKIRIEGHTDNAGKANKNLSLSQRRAEAVMRYLVDKGVDTARLEAVGYGQTRPIAQNTNARGRARNRRVEFVILAEPQ